MEILFEQEITNVAGQRIKVSFFRRDARSPMEIKNNDPIRYEHCRSLEVFIDGQWRQVAPLQNPNTEEIIEYITLEINEN